MRKFMAGGIFGLILAACGIYVTMWQFWVIVVGSAVLWDWAS